MKEVLDIFKKITKIPHCSGNTEKMREFLIEWIKKSGYEHKVDEAGNVLAFKNKPVLCLQSHYDMVCVGSAPNIEIVEEEGWLKAKNSSLGADNGIGVAIMLYLMKKHDNLEFLFTNDEEIGLIGAFNLNLDIKSRYLLNLDSEDENIYIGCAGGVDVKVKYPVEYIKCRGFCADINIQNLPGGHSGVDIDKEIPNAIVELIKKVGNICSIKGGERRNSIPANAYAKVCFESENGKEMNVISKDYLKFLKKLPHGVLEYDFEFQVVSKSVNFAMVENENIILTLRANSNEKLEEVKEYIKQKCAGAEIEFEGEYPAWKPEVSELARMLKEIMNTEYKVIHAGLECAVLKNKLTNVSMASIGPIIENPHSVNERVNLKSVEKIFNTILKLIERMKNE
ncbi:M20/M25/M40 family metallo-hydrolase [Nautilia lithotrophica]